MAQNNDDEAVGERIAEARHAAGLSQAALAEAVGVSRSAVAQWETGRSGQVRGNLVRIAAVLGVPPAWLIDGGRAGGGAGAAGAGRADAVAETATELALLRLYRACAEPDQALLLRTARRLARADEAG